MYYLKCHNCGYLNKVDGEYLIFCNACGKKLQNNFRDWKRRNPDKSFDDFKTLICFQGNEVQPQISKKRRSLGVWRYFILAFLLAAVVLAFSHFYGKGVLSVIEEELTSWHILEEEWEIIHFTQFGLSVEAPFELKQAELHVSDDVRPFINEMESRRYETNDGFGIIVNCIRYDEEIGNISIQGAAEGTVNEIKMQTGVKDFKYTEGRIKTGGIAGIRQKGSFLFHSNKVEFYNYVYGEDFSIWQIAVHFPANDQVAERAARRVIESVEINYKENP